MQTTRPPTHRLRFSPPSPAAFGLSVTDHQEALQELLYYLSVPPEQLYGPRPSRADRRPEAALMRAVLADALGCFQQGLVYQGRRVQRLAREAEEWLFSDDAGWSEAGASMRVGSPSIPVRRRTNSPSSRKVSNTDPNSSVIEESSEANLSRAEQRIFSRTVGRQFGKCRKFGSSFQAQRKFFNSLQMAFLLHYEE